MSRRPSSSAASEVRLPLACKTTQRPSGLAPIHGSVVEEWMGRSTDAVRRGDDQSPSRGGGVAATTEARTMARLDPPTRGSLLARALALRTLALAALLSVAAAFPANAASYSPGAAGLGDRLNPGIGNGGYDVQDYDLRLRYATADPSQPVEGDETITARATQGLSQFNLDFGGKSVGGVAVNGAPAKFKRTGEELIVTPASPINNGATFTVVVTDFTAVPSKITWA